MTRGVGVLWKMRIRLWLTLTAFGVKDFLLFLMATLENMLPNGVDDISIK